MKEKQLNKAFFGRAVAMVADKVGQTDPGIRASALHLLIADREKYVQRLGSAYGYCHAAAWFWHDCGWEQEDWKLIVVVALFLALRDEQGVPENEALDRAVALHAADESAYYGT